MELGIVLWILLGWHFVLAELVGSFVLIGIMWILVALTLPRGLLAKVHQDDGESGNEGCCHHHDGGGHDHHDHSGHGGNQSWTGVADTFFMDVSMMWKEILIGVLIAGVLMTVVPEEWWKVLFVTDIPQPWRLMENTVVGVLVAVASFTCSIGNIPLASLLWSGGISFGGVISFIFGDLVIIPLLLIYRKYYGTAAATYISVILFVSMVVAGIVVDLLFSALGLVPTGPRPPNPIESAGFQWNYTTWLDLAAIAVMGWFAWLHFSRKSS